MRWQLPIIQNRDKIEYVLYVYGYFRPPFIYHSGLLLHHFCRILTCAHFTVCSLGFKEISKAPGIWKHTAWKVGNILVGSGLDGISYTLNAIRYSESWVKVVVNPNSGSLRWCQSFMCHVRHAAWQHKVAFSLAKISTVVGAQCADRVPMLACSNHSVLTFPQGLQMRRLPSLTASERYCNIYAAQAVGEPYQS